MQPLQDETVYIKSFCQRIGRRLVTILSDPTYKGFLRAVTSAHMYEMMHSNDFLTYDRYLSNLAITVLPCDSLDDFLLSDEDSSAASALLLPSIRTVPMYSADGTALGQARSQSPPTCDRSMLSLAY